MNPMIKYFLLADNITNDVFSKKLSVTGIFDNFTISIFPSVAPRFFIVLGFWEVDKPFRIAIQVFSPDGQLQAQLEQEYTFELPQDTINAIFEINGLPLIKRGKYTLKVIYLGNNEVLGNYYFKADYPPKRKFTDQDINNILQNPKLAKGAKIKIECPKCNKKYNLELNLDPTKPISKDFHPFPEDNIIKCCEETIDLTGIRRQIEWNFGTEISK